MNTLVGLLMPHMQDWSPTCFNFICTFHLINMGNYLLMHPDLDVTYLVIFLKCFNFASFCFSVVCLVLVTIGLIAGTLIFLICCALKCFFMFIIVAFWKTQL